MIQTLKTLLATSLAPYPAALAASRYRLATQVLAFFLLLPAIVQILGTVISPETRQFALEPTVIVRSILLASEGMLLAGLLMAGLSKKAVWGYCFGLLLAGQSVIWGVQGAVYPWFGPVTPLELGVPIPVIAVPWATLAASLFLFLALLKSRGFFPQAFERVAQLPVTAEETAVPLRRLKAPRTASGSPGRPRGRKARAR